tara:strand:+ start:4486 stop:5196 length:711 start_codon:yes stop_codon:yes gene_type:complete
MTYLCTKSFIPGFIALRNSISKNTSKDYIFSVVATEELKPYENYINKYCDNLIFINKIFSQRVDGIQDRYKDNSWMMFSKLNIFNQTKFEKILYIDADCIVLKDELDEIFNNNEVSAVQDVGYGGLSAGVVLLRPSSKMFNEMIKKINLSSYDNTYSDQSFLNWYFPTYNKLDIKFNTLEKRIPISDDTVIFHFNGQKPWLAKNENGWAKEKNSAYYNWHKYFSITEKLKFKIFCS